jgi:GT2 family glycosyltransferase
MQLDFPRVYVIVLNYNGQKWLQACFRTLLATDYPNFVTVMVDNASTDESSDFVDKHFPDVHIIQNQTNLGFCEGNNVGIRYALDNEADYVVLLNNDTKVPPDWLKELIKIVEAEREIGILGPVQYSYEGDDLGKWTKGALTEYLHLLKDGDNPVPFFEVEWVEASAILIRRAVFEKIGLLAPVFFIFFEEVDFCRRATYHGFKIAVSTRSRIYHYGGGWWYDNLSIRRSRNYLCDRNQLIYTLTDPDRSLIGNLLAGIHLQLVRSKRILLNADFRGIFPMIRMQFWVLIHFREVWRKWRRDRQSQDKVEKC